MDVLRATLSSCQTATGWVVAIDVLRAFTTAGYLFEAGAEAILLASGVEEAFQLRDAMPDCLLLGEVDGIPIPGFDLGNSPAAILGRDFSGKRIIQRTTAGTQGVTLAANASVILTAALTNVSATARYLRAAAPRQVTLIQTGLLAAEGWGDEDVACADAIEDLLNDWPVDWAQIARRVRSSRSGLHFDGTRTDFPPQDLELALAVDRFAFAMRVERERGLRVLRKVAV